MKRIILMVLKNLLFVPYGWFKLCYTASHVDKYTEEERYQVLKMIDRRANWGGRITIDAHGVENIPEKDGFMFFPNHQGLYEDIRQGLKVIQQVADEVKKGRNYLIFAEGTRSKMQNKLQEFKGGSFKSAVKAQCPIVPVALIDSYKSFDTNSIEKLTVQVHFLKPIPYEEYQGMKTTQIAAMVKERIEDTIARYE